MRRVPCGAGVARPRWFKWSAGAGAGPVRARVCARERPQTQRGSAATSWGCCCPAGRARMRRRRSERAGVTHTLPPRALGQAPVLCPVCCPILQRSQASLNAVVDGPGRRKRRLSEGTCGGCGMQLAPLGHAPCACSPLSSLPGGTSSAPDLRRPLHRPANARASRLLVASARTSARPACPFRRAAPEVHSRGCIRACPHARPWQHFDARLHCSRQQPVAAGGRRCKAAGGWRLAGPAWTPWLALLLPCRRLRASATMPVEHAGNERACCGHWAGAQQIE